MRCLWYFVSLSLVALVRTVWCSTSRPNILFVVVDDLGYNDLGYKHGVQGTPTIDRYAKQGINLNQYYVDPVCSPTRGTFMSGRYSFNCGVDGVIGVRDAYGMRLNEVTIAEKLKAAQYDTHIVGKWHLGYHKWSYTPTFRGFNSFMGYYFGAEDYFKHTTEAGYDFHLQEGTSCGEGCSRLATDSYGRYSTHIYTERTIELLQKKRDKSKPFYIYLAFQAMHAPAQVPNEYIERFQKSIPDPKRRIFAGMLNCLDEGIANITKVLKEENLFNNTIIVISTDNGGPTETPDGIGSRNYPLRGGKHAEFEGGQRGIGIFYYHDLLSPSLRQDKQMYNYNKMMHSSDWFATLSQFVGLDLDSKLPLDGVSHHENFEKILQGRISNAELDTPRIEIPYGHPYKRRIGIRHGDLKYLQPNGGKPDGYCNMTSDGTVCMDISAYNTTCGSSDYCLYNVSVTSNDMWSNELIDVTPLVDTQTVRLLRTQMKSIFSQYVPHELDDCGSFVTKVDPTVGKYIYPWCHQQQVATQVE